MQSLDSQLARDFFGRLSAAGRGCLMLDYDGTLAPFKTDRAAAVPYPGVADLLERIIDGGKTRLAVVSGRAVREVRDLLKIRSGLQYWGSHGAEQIDINGNYSSYELGADQIRGVRLARELLESLVPPQHIELKPFSVALHWRGVAEQTAHSWNELVVPRWHEIAGDCLLAVHEFSGGLEIRPGDATKATAVRSILRGEPNTGTVAYLGDDLTDEDAFGALPPGGLPVLVGDIPWETRASLFLRRFDEVLEFLARWHAGCG